MAHGLLILLIGEENKNRQAYLHLDKTYVVEILFGFETDTYDTLGKITKVSQLQEVTKLGIENAVHSSSGKQEQVYPPYSSKAVLGKPLFWWARNNKLDEIVVPTRVVEIYDIALLEKKKISGKALLKDIQEKIAKVNGNFRQETIVKEWKKNIDKNVAYSLIKISVDCSSGTYMRTLAYNLGKKLGCGAIAYDIYRTKVGEYTL
jgi:tRNA pseudouridine55 synthase